MKDNIRKYFVTLTPLDKFFFGGERTLGQGDYANYFVKSNYFPQQTGILGLIRYELLAQKNWLSSKGKRVPKEAKSLIGPHSFKIKRDGDNNFIENDFGEIESVSQLFIVKLDKAGKVEKKITQNSLLHFKGDDFDGYKIVNYKNSSINYLYKRFTEGKLLRKDIYGRFQSKEGVFNGLVDEQGNNYDYKCVFQEDMQIGIKKMSEKDGFYKQTFLRLKPGYAFAFYVNLKGNSDYKFESSLTKMGGEQSGFKMNVSMLEESEHWNLPIYDLSYSKCLESETDNFKIFVLNSHSFCEPSVYKLCEFGMTDTLDFRFIETKIDETEFYNNYDPKEHKEKNLNKSGKYTLIKAGSIFLIKNDNEEKFTKLLNNVCFQQIGYNQYTEIKN